MNRAKERPPPEDPQRTPKGAYMGLADKAYVARRDELKDRIPTAMGIICRHLGWTHKELGLLMGLSQAAVKHRLYGRTEFTASELLAVADALGIPPQAFYDRDFPFEEVLRRRQA